jgi:hypothetical protein
MHYPFVPFALAITCMCLPGSTRLQAQTPQIIPLNTAQAWTRAEFRIDHTPAATNCFDPDLIRLDATFTSPSGQAVTVPAFWFQDYSRALRNGSEVLTPSGPPQWRVRFTPVEPGEYKLSLGIQTNGSPAGSAVTTHFHVLPAAPSIRQGFVRVAPDKRYFETSEGHPLRLVGHNVCWAESQGTFDYDAWFGAMKGAGENFARLWLAPWFMPLEHKPGTLNHYDLEGAWQLDTIFQLAEQDGIYLLLSFDHHGMYQVDNQNWGGSNNFWKTNPYNELIGGPCATPNDFFTNARARAIYQKRLRYLVARYGSSPNLLAWQFFNEIDNVYGSLHSDDVLAWHREMGQWFRANDPYHHLVTTSMTGGSERPEIWALPEMDFAVYHSYNEAAPGKGAALVAQSFFKQYNKPAMIGEFGIDARTWNIAADPYLRGFRQGLWGGALGGAVGTSMAWWWQDMHFDNVYPVYKSLNEILDRGGYQSGTWIAVEFAGVTSPPNQLREPVPNSAPFEAQLSFNPAWRQKRKLTGEIAVANPLSSTRSSENLSGFLHGSKDGDLQRPVRVTAFFGAKAKFTFHVKAVVPETELVVRVDSKELLRRKLGGARTTPPKQEEINQDFAFDLQPGKHTIEIGNDGFDWILLNSLKLEQVQPAEFARGWTFPLEPVGLRRDKNAIVYVCSPWVVFPAGASRYNPPLQTGQVLNLANWPAGKFNAEWFDPCTGRSIGKTTGTVEGNTLSVPVPAFSDDAAAIITPAAE